MANIIHAHTVHEIKFDDCGNEQLLSVAPHSDNEDYILITHGAVDEINEMTLPKVVVPFLIKALQGCAGETGMRGR